MKNIAQFLRQCDGVANGDADGLNLDAHPDRDSCAPCVQIKMKSSSTNPKQPSALAGDSNAAAEGFKLHAPSSPGGASFFSHR